MTQSEEAMQMLKASMAEADAAHQDGFGRHKATWEKEKAQLSSEVEQHITSSLNPIHNPNPNELV